MSLFARCRGGAEVKQLMALVDALETQLAAARATAAKLLHERARAFHNELHNQQWGPVRIIHCWPLLLVEQGLELYLGQAAPPCQGYKLAADFCQHDDPRYGNSLNGPSRAKFMEVVRFMFTLEMIGEENAGGTPPARPLAFHAAI